MWTWAAIERDSKMILSFEIGDRSGATAIGFMDDPRARLATRVQMTADGHKAYLEAVEGAFRGDLDCAMLAKLYGEASGRNGHERKSGPAECVAARKEPITMSYVERQNLSMRMAMRRFTRLTNGFNKKLENNPHMRSPYFVHCNLVRAHMSLRMTPAMAPGVSNPCMTWNVSSA